jgi:hypothetical protein
VWSFFTRVNDFQPTCSQAMCELHFSDKCVSMKQGEGRKFMRARSVPTIYYRENGERVEVGGYSYKQYALNSIKRYILGTLQSREHGVLWGRG